jgi:uncharacterized membrane protein
MSKPKKKYFDKESINYPHVFASLFLYILALCNIVQIFPVNGNSMSAMTSIINFIVLFFVAIWFSLDYKPTIKKVYINEETA